MIDERKTPEYIKDYAWLERGTENDLEVMTCHMLKRNDRQNISSMGQGPAHPIYSHFPSTYSSAQCIQMVLGFQWFDLMAC